MSTMTIEPTYSSVDVAFLTGASNRQLDRYTTLRLAGNRPGQGAGRRRTYTTTDLEVVHALQELLAHGAPVVSLARIVADAVRARPVAPAGEWLIVVPEPASARRFERYLLDDIAAAEAPRLWPVRLRSFSTVALPVPEGGDAVLAEHALPPVGTGSGAVGSLPAPPQVPSPGGSTNDSGVS